MRLNKFNKQDLSLSESEHKSEIMSSKGSLQGEIFLIRYEWLSIYFR